MRLRRRRSLLFERAGASVDSEASGSRSTASDNTCSTRGSYRGCGGARAAGWARGE